MTKKKPAVSNRGTGASLVPALLGLLKPVALALAAAIGSIVAYVMTPLNEVVNSFLWNEKTEVLLIAQNASLAQGDVLNLDVFIQPTSPVPLSEGTLIITYPKGLVRPGPESATSLVLSTPKLSSSKKITERSLEFIADEPGKGNISATLKTRNGHIFRAAIPIEVFPLKDQLFPTRRNFSGQWNIDLGDISGHMALKDVARTLTGEYRLSDGNLGLIEGTHDGDTFDVTFFRSSTPSRYFVHAEFDPNPAKQFELKKGEAKLKIPALEEPSGWKTSYVTSFHAVAQGR